MTLFSLRRDGYFHCCICPVRGEDAWPRAFARAHAPGLLVEYDLEGEATRLSGWMTVDEQLAPADVVANLRVLGDQPTLDSAGIPLAWAEQLSPGRGNHIHYFTCVVPAAGADSRTAWNEAAAVIKHTLLPDDWSGLAHCGAIFHYADEEFAYLLSPDEELLSEWVEDAIARRFPAVADRPAVLRTVRQWVVASFDRTGGTLLDVQVDGEGRSVRIRATIGRPAGVPLQFGIPGERPVEATLTIG